MWKPAFVLGCRRHPQDSDAWEMLGGVLFDQGRMDDALTALRQVREVDREWANAQLVIGEIAIRQRRLAEAEECFRGASARNRRAVEPLERLVSLLTLERRPAEARSVLRRLFQITRDPRYLADSILVSEIESEVRDLSPEIEEFLNKLPTTPGCAGSGACSCSHEVGRPKPCLTLKPRPRPSKKTPWDASPWRNAGWRSASLRTIFPSSARRRVGPSMRRDGGCYEAGWKRLWAGTMRPSKACGRRYRPILGTRRPTFVSVRS